jgi:hypothetical protein
MDTQTVSRPLDDDPVTVELVKRFELVTRQINRLRSDREYLRELLIKAFGANSLGVWRGMVGGREVAKVAVRSTHRFDATAFREDHPDLYSQYVVVGEAATVTADTGAMSS